MQPCAPPLTSASLVCLRGRSQGPRGFLRGSPRPAASSTVSSSTPRRPALPRRFALPRSRRIASLRGRSTRRLPASRPAPASLWAPGLASSRGGSAGAAALAWRRVRAGRGRLSHRGDAQGGGTRRYSGSAPGMFPGLREGWPLGAPFDLTPSPPSVPAAALSEFLFRGSRCRPTGALTPRAATPAGRTPCGWDAPQFKREP